MGELVHLFGSEGPRGPRGGPPPEAEGEPEIDWDLEEDRTPWEELLLEGLRCLERVEADVWVAASRLAGWTAAPGLDVAGERRRQRLERHWDPHVRALAALARQAQRAAVDVRNEVLDD